MKFVGPGALAVAAQAFVLLAAIRYGTDGAVSFLAAIALAPVAVFAVAGLGRRLDGRGFGLACAATYVLLPFVATRIFLGSYHHIYLHDVLPYLLGLRVTWWFLAGVAVAIAARVAPRTVFAGAGAVAALVGVVVWGVGHLGEVKVGLHESAWSVAFLEWLPVAGVVGAARRSPLVATGLGGWLVFFVLRAAHHPVADGAFWRALAPALPAAAVLLASVWLLVPRLRRAAGPHPTR